MINFGVREVANSKATAAPGWAYVPDIGVNASGTASQPSSRKRARNQQSVATSNETTAKQDAKILRELAALDRENHRDVSIPVPVRQRDNAGRATHGKVTPAVRKILQSQKTFANHLSDFDALAAITTAPSQPAPAQSGTNSGRGTPISAAANLSNAAKRSQGRGSGTATPLRKGKAASRAGTPVAIKAEPSMKDKAKKAGAPILSVDGTTAPAFHPGDADPLLISRIPRLPTQEEVEALLGTPPLNYHEARGAWTDEDRRKPVRRFCEVCGYWGRVRCKRCEGRVCALECLTVHQEDCFTRYGA